MAVYYMNEGAFELPEGAAVRDWTTHVVRARVDGHDLTLAVCRAHFPPEKSLRQLAQGRVLEEAQSLARYRVLESRETSWDGVPVVEFDSRWSHEKRLVYQRQGHLAHEGVWMFFAVSTKIEGRAAADAWFERIRETLRFRGD